MQSIVKKSQYFYRKLFLLRRKQLNGAILWRRLCTRVPGERKTLAPAYQPLKVEANKWHREVERPSNPVGTYRMILPPPNVTGNLHLGHALMATVQDVICRHQRQLGFDVIWVPGTDHAGIATQVVVEKKLRKERGVTRNEIGRKAFLREVWHWKRAKVDSIEDDLLKLGCSLNWEKEYFTMDEKRSYAVNTAFIKLFEEGLIRRKKSLVNWSCALESAISDIEVDMLEIKEPTSIFVPGHKQNVTFGRLYDIAYKVCDTDDEIIVATTRPETILGDVAVAVHPEDERYLKYRHKDVKLWHPFRKEAIPLIFDIWIEPRVGTGAVKITPAHDKNDFELAERHMLGTIPVFTEKGTIVDKFEDFMGLPRFEARERILNALAAMDLLRTTQPRAHPMALPICLRSKDVIEYMVRPQWFLHCQPMADAALSELNSGRLRIIPENYEQEWKHWLYDCHDWCISRQLWWGHQIPAYLAKDAEGREYWVAALNEKVALKLATERMGSKPTSLERDEDVLDTWFSSALLPLSAFNWPDANYRQNYPLDLLETGHDILFFWAARMVMLGVKLTGQVPFKKLLLNGIVCDARGRKMSKSLGNVVTPQQVVQGASLETLRQGIENSYQSGIISSQELRRSLEGMEKMFPKGIPECGTDALRFTLCSHNIKHHFINFDVNECYANKLFLNKIWQATRYTLGAAERMKLPLSEIESIRNVQLGLWDRWILSRLAITMSSMVKGLDQFNFYLATAALKDFFYSCLCDVYVETTKLNVNNETPKGYIHCATLAACLSWGLQAMSPITPFIAAELLQHLPRKIEINPSKYYDATLESEIGAVLDICQQVRQLKSHHKISKKHDPHVSLFVHTKKDFQLLQPHLDEMRTLTRTTNVEVEMLSPRALTEKKVAYSFFATAGATCTLGIQVNTSYWKSVPNSMEVQDLNVKKLQKLQKELDLYRLRVSNESFIRSASEQVQQKHQEKIRQLELEILNIKNLES